MPVRADYRLSRMEVAAIVAQDDVRELAYLVRQVPLSWELLEQSGDPRNMTTVRQLLLDYLGAAYALGERAAFAAGLAGFLHYPLASSTSYRATPADMLPDLCIGISVPGSDVATISARAILARPAGEDTLMPLGAVARTLSFLLAGAFDSARTEAQAIVDACEAKRFRKNVCLYFDAWAGAALGLASIDARAFRNGADAVHAARRAWLERELGRAAAGRPSDLASADLWDWMTTPLVALAQRMYPDEPGVSEGLGLPFADAGWVAAAALALSPPIDAVPASGPAAGRGPGMGR